MPEVDLVEVGLEDLLLVVLRFEGYREGGFGGLALERTFGGEVAVFDQLLGDGAAALLDLAGQDVLEQGAGDRDAVEPDVLEETGVFGGEQRPPHPLRQFGELDRHPHRAFAVERFGDQLGLEHQLLVLDLVPALGFAAHPGNEALLAAALERQAD